MKYTDVFVPGGFPRHTYNPRVDLRLESSLQQAKENLCKLVVVTGHTKSGKTVLTRSVFPPQDTIWIDGGSVGAEDDFWTNILDQLELFQGETDQEQDSSTTTIGTQASAEGGVIIAKAAGSVSASNATARGRVRSRTRQVSPKVAALKGLATTRTPIIVDDFHYLPKDMQGKIVRALKPLIFDGLPAIIIAIPHRRYDAMKVEREMTGRISSIEIPAWTDDELQFIPSKGFKLLGAELADGVTGKLAREAIGSPHLVQDFCRTLCSIHGIAGGGAIQNLSEDQIKAVFADVANTIGRPIFEKLARGPRQRTDRVERTLHNGSKVDIYQLVLHALAHLRPGLISLEYEDLRTAIREVSATAIPQLHEVARVLKHMATIASTDQSSTPVIDFEEHEKKLHITDPFFAFYLRWGDLSA